MKTLRCVSWVAVSSDDQAEDDKISIPDQLKGNLQFIESIEKLYSGFQGVCIEKLEVTDSRKIILLEDACRRYAEYQRLHDMIRAKEFDVLVAHKWDRIGRTESLVLSIRDLCLDHGIVVVVRESMPNTLDIGKLKYDEGYRVSGMVQAWGAGAAVRDISRKVKLGRTNAVIQKKNYMGEWPYGYKWKYDADGNREIVADPDAARVIRLILIGLFLDQGMGRPSITEELNRRGIPSARGGKWGISSVESLLKKVRTYAGYLEFNRNSDQEFISIKGKHPAIITEHELAQLEKELDERSHGTRAKHPYTGVCVCVECGSPMYTKTIKYTTLAGKLNTYYFMTCWPCGYGINEKYLESALHRAVDEVDAQGINEESNEPDHTTIELTERIARINQEIASHEKAIENLIDALETGDISTASLHRRLQDRQSNIETLKLELVARSRELSEYQNSGTRSDRLTEIVADGHRMIDIARDEPLEARRWMRNHFKVEINRQGIHHVSVV